MINNMYRDKFLTELLGNKSKWICNECDVITDSETCSCETAAWSRWRFSSPDRFFILFNWAQEQEWFDDFYWNSFITDDGRTPSQKHIDKIHPDRFADVLYSYLKENK